MSRTSRSQKSWTGVMIEDPRFVGSSLARWRARWSARFTKCRRDGDGAARGAHVVRADHGGALEYGDGRGREPGLEPLIDRQVEDLPEEALARGPHHHRAAECRELVEARDQLQIVREGLAESDPGIERHGLLPDAGGA